MDAAMVRQARGVRGRRAMKALSIVTGPFIVISCAMSAGSQQAVAAAPASGLAASPR